MMSMASLTCMRNSSSGRRWSSMNLSRDPAGVFLSSITVLGTGEPEAAELLPESVSFCLFCCLGLEAVKFHFTGREELCCCWFRFLEREEFCPESLFLVCLSANGTLLPKAPVIPQTCQFSQLFPPEPQNYSLPLPGRLACLVCLQTVL